MELTGSLQKPCSAGLSKQSSAELIPIRNLKSQNGNRKTHKNENIISRTYLAHIPPLWGG